MQKNGENGERLMEFYLMQLLNPFNQTLTPSEILKFKDILEKRNEFDGIENFKEEWGNVDKFLEEMENEISPEYHKKLKTSCDFEIYFRNGERIIYFYDENPENFDGIEILTPEFADILCDEYFSHLEKEIEENEKMLRRLEKRKRIENKRLRKVISNWNDFIVSRIKEGRYPLAIVHGNNVYYLGDRRKALRGINSLIRATKNAISLSMLDGSLPSMKPLSEIEFLHSLEKISNKLRSKETMEFNPDYLTSSLYYRLSSINAKDFEPKKNSKRKIAAALGLLGALLGGFIAYRLYKTYRLMNDRDPPFIKEVNYKMKISPNSEQKVKISLEDESGIEKVIVEYNNKNYTATPSNQKYVVQFPVNEEGKLSFKIYAIDKVGNAAVLTKEFESYDDPKINFVNYKFIPPDKLFLNVSAQDTSGINKVIANIQDKSYTLEKSNGFYIKEIRDGLISKLEKLPVTVYVFDKFKNFAKKVIEAIPTLKDKFVSFSMEKGVKENVAERFYDDYSYLVSELYPTNSDLLLPMVKLSENMSLFNLISKIVQNDERITLDKNYALSKIAKLFSDLNFIGKVKVYDPKTDSYKESYLSLPTIYNIGNYCLAVYQLNLPMHNKSDLWLAFNASQLEPLMFINKKIILPSANSSDVILPINSPMLSYGLVEHLKRIREKGINILKYPEMLEGIGIKTWSNVFWTFDYKYGIAYMEKRGNVDLTLDNETLWDIYMKQFAYYWNATPQAGNVSKIRLFYPWYNSSMLREYYPNLTDRRMAGLWGFRLPERTVDLEKGSGKEGMVFGINAAYTFLKQIQEKKEEILPKLNDPYWKDKTLTKFAGNLIDRANHGLKEAISQFIGYNYSEITYGYELEEIIQNTSIPGIIQTLLKYNPQLTHRIIFSIGYATYEASKWGGDTYTTYYGIPTYCGIFLIPHSRMALNPMPPGAGDDWIISVPYQLVRKVYETFPNSSILIAPGNMIGIYSGGDGLIKDGIKKAFQWIGYPYRVYLMKLEE